MPTRYVNNWLAQLESELAAGASALPVPAAALERLDLTGGGEYVLTITNSLDPSEQSAFEVVRLSSVGMARGEEGTTDRAWPAGSYAYCSITAGELEKLANSAGGSAIGGYVGARAAGSYPIPPGTQSLYVNSNYDPGPEPISLEFEPVDAGKAYALDFSIFCGGAQGRTVEVNVPNSEPSGTWSSFVDGYDSSIVGGAVEQPGQYSRIVGLAGLIVGRAIVSRDVDGFGVVSLTIFSQQA